MHGGLRSEQGSPPLLRVRWPTVLYHPPPPGHTDTSTFECTTLKTSWLWEKSSASALLSHHSVERHVPLPNSLPRQRTGEATQGRAPFLLVLLTSWDLCHKGVPLPAWPWTATYRWEASGAQRLPPTPCLGDRWACRGRAIDYCPRSPWVVAQRRSFPPATGSHLSGRAPDRQSSFGQCPRGGLRCGGSTLRTTSRPGTASSIATAVP